MNDNYYKYYTIEKSVLLCYKAIKNYVKIDKNDEIVIPKSRKEKITSSFERVFADIDNYYYTKMIFFSMFLPITLTTYYMVLARNERHFMRDNFGDFAIHMLVWIAAASFAGSILVSFLTATL